MKPLPPCNRCGATSFVTHTKACRRRQRAEDVACELIVFVVMLPLYPVGLALSLYDRLRRNGSQKIHSMRR